MLGIDRVSRWRTFWTNSKNLGRAWLITVGIVALYVGAIHPRERAVGINNSKAAGLAADEVEPLAMWRSMWTPKSETPMYQEGIMGGISGSRITPMAYMATPSLEDSDKERKVVRTSSLDLIVPRPADAVEKIRVLVENLGGFLVSSQIAGGQDATGASLTVRVPVSRFEEARSAIRNLSLRVESERVEAQDVTRQYVDESAGLRNLKAEQAQYLLILKRAQTVKETLDVTEKLGAVQGQIEQQQAEFETLSKQIETVSLSIVLRTEAEARIFGLRWRPLYQIKLAFRDGLEGLATYASTMMELIFFLPTVLLWLVTILAGAALGWRVLRWVGRKAFRLNLGASHVQA